MHKAQFSRKNDLFSHLTFTRVVGVILLNIFKNISVRLNLIIKFYFIFFAAINNMYEIGTGSRSNLYSRNRFTIRNELSVIVENIPQNEIFSRESAPKRSNLFG